MGVLSKYSFTIRNKTKTKTTLTMKVAIVGAAGETNQSIITALLQRREDFVSTIIPPVAAMR